MRRALRFGGALIGVLMLAAALGLALAHRDIRSLDPELPDVDALLAAGRAAADRPTSLARIETARQRMPRSAVLDPRLDPNPGEPYEMTFPAFALRWPDGRGILIDAGMDEASARRFGRPLELLVGAEPLAPRGSLPDQLGPDARAAFGLVVTHLHADHTQGTVPLCAARAGAAPIPLFQTRDQTERRNYTTRPGAALLDEAGCLRPTLLPELPLAPLEGFGGVFVIRAAGHTPDSQLVVAFVGAGSEPRGYVFTGDVVNHIDGIRADVPKPRMYRWLVVPEAEARLGRVRRFLRDLEQRGFVLLVSHDARHLDSLAIPAWREPGGNTNATGLRAFAALSGVRYAREP